MTVLTIILLLAACCPDFVVMLRLRVCVNVLVVPVPLKLGDIMIALARLWVWKRPISMGRVARRLIGMEKKLRIRLVRRATAIIWDVLVADSRLVMRCLFRETCGVLPPLDCVHVQRGTMMPMRVVDVFWVVLTTTSSLTRPLRAGGYSGRMTQMLPRW